MRDLAMWDSAVVRGPYVAIGLVQPGAVLACELEMLVVEWILPMFLQVGQNYRTEFVLLDT